MLFGLIGGNKKLTKYEKMSTEELKAQASVLRNEVVNPEISSSEKAGVMLDTALTGAVGGFLGHFYGGKAGEMKIRKPFMPENAGPSSLRTAKREMSELISLVHENPAAAEGLLQQAHEAGKIRIPEGDISKVAEQFIKDIKRYHVGGKWAGLALGATALGVLNYLVDIRSLESSTRADKAEDLGYVEKVLAQRHASQSQEVSKG